VPPGRTDQNQPADLQSDQNEHTDQIEQLARTFEEGQQSHQPQAQPSPPPDYQRRGKRLTYNEQQRLIRELRGELTDAKRQAVPRGGRPPAQQDKAVMVDLVAEEDSL